MIQQWGQKCIEPFCPDDNDDDPNDDMAMFLPDGYCGETFEEAFLKCTPCIDGNPACADPSHQCFKTQSCRYDLREFKIELSVTLYSSEGAAAELDGAEDLPVIAKATMNFLNSIGPRRHGVLLFDSDVAYGSNTINADGALSFELLFILAGYLRSETVTDGFGAKGILSDLIADHPEKYVDALVDGAADAGRDLSFLDLNRVLVGKDEDVIGTEVAVPPERPPCRIECLNGGLCMPAGVDYPTADYCNCTTAVVDGNPHAGERCEYPATKSCMTLGSETKHSFCTNGGECVAIVEDYSFHQGCVCPVGWVGAKCELVLESIAPTPSHSFYFEDEVRDYRSVGVGFCLDESRNAYSKLISEEMYESAVYCPRVCIGYFGMGMHSFEYSSTGKCACLFNQDDAPEAQVMVPFPYSTELGLGQGPVAGASGNVGVLCYAALEYEPTPARTPAPTPAPTLYDASLDCACGVDWMDAYTNCKPTCRNDGDCLLELGPDYKCQVGCPALHRLASWFILVFLRLTFLSIYSVLHDLSNEGRSVASQNRGGARGNILCVTLGSCGRDDGGKVLPIFRPRSNSHVRCHGIHSDDTSGFCVRRRGALDVEW